MRVQIHQFPMSNSCNKKPRVVNKHKLIFLLQSLKWQSNNMVNIIEQKSGFDTSGAIKNAW